MTEGGCNPCKHCTLLVTLCCSIVASCTAQSLLQSVVGEVTAENYTYYRLSRHGALVLKLHTTSGDADLYVSDQTLKPTYSDYEAQSVTCGLDVVEIPYAYERPVGVAVYGYISHEVSQYSLEIHLISDADPYAEFTDYSNENENEQSEYGHDSHDKRVPPRLPKETDDEESPWWTLLVGILKIILEVIV